MSFRQNLLCDVTIVVDTTEIPAHKVVLSSCSQYFYAMFTGDLAEAKSDRITLQEIDPKALIQLIDFVYTSEIHVTEENVQVSYYYRGSFLLFQTLFRVRRIEKNDAEFKLE